MKTAGVRLSEVETEAEDALYSTSIFFSRQVEPLCRYRRLLINSKAVSTIYSGNGCVKSIWRRSCLSCHETFLLLFVLTCTFPMLRRTAMMFFHVCDLARCWIKSQKNKKIDTKFTSLPEFQNKRATSVWSHEEPGATDPPDQPTSCWHPINCLEMTNNPYLKTPLTILCACVHVVTQTRRICITVGFLLATSTL